MVRSAYRSTNAEGDDFVFAYSTDDATYTTMATVVSATEQTYTYALPAGLTGTIYVRVQDTNREWGFSSYDDVAIDEMFIEYESGPVAPTAEFVGDPTAGPAALTVNFTDLSTGNPTSWSWDFGDGVGTSTVQNPSYTYNNIGTYTVTLTATNAYGSDIETKVDYITVTDPNAAIHVSNMVVTQQRSGPNSYGNCVVTIVDQNGSPVGNATVFADYDGPTSGSTSGVTASDGTVALQSSEFKKPSGEWCFTVTNVTHPTQAYDSNANEVTRACESGPVYASGDPAVASESLPTEFGLNQNYPNPFNPTTEIAFALPNASMVTLEVYNVVGQRVAVLADGTFGAGNHIVTWDASAMSSGVYFYRLVTSEFVDTKKMLLVK